MNGIVAAMFDAYITTLTTFDVDSGLRCRVKFKFAPHAGASHAEVLQCTAESGLLVSFEVVHGNDNICIGNGGTDFGSFAIFTVDFDFTVFGPFQAVGDNHIAFGGNRIETVFHCTFQMIYSIGATT